MSEKARLRESLEWCCLYVVVGFKFVSRVFCWWSVNLVIKRIANPSKSSVSGTRQKLPAITTMLRFSDSIICHSMKRALDNTLLDKRLLI